MLLNAGKGDRLLMIYLDRSRNCIEEVQSQLLSVLRRKDTASEVLAGCDRCQLILQVLQLLADEVHEFKIVFLGPA